jgi:hypothetical protein
MNSEINNYCFKIGQNNITKKREIKKGMNILLDSGIKGFEVALSKGCWINEKNQIEEEKSFNFSILDLNKDLDLNKMKMIKSKLEKELKQEYILLSINKVNLI